MQRPKIENIPSGKELKKWYWLKSELVAYAKIKRIARSGTKFELLDRIALELDGKKSKKVSLVEKQSKFDWSKESLNLNTRITDSYTNGPNTRAFFKKHCGNKFHFSIPFMKWMKENQGNKLKDAVAFWKTLEQELKKPGFQTIIPEGNQYNKYLRDFFADNPSLSIEDARRCWKLKKNFPLERHVYERSDLKLK